MKAPVEAIRWAARLCVFVVAVAVPCGAQPAKNVEQELVELQHDWATARMHADIDFLEQLYANEFRITALNGSVVERRADIAAFASGDLKPESVTNEDLSVSIYGDAAVVTGLEKVKGTYKGISGEFALRFTNVFVRRDGRWQLVVHHATEVRRPEAGRESD